MPFAVTTGLLGLLKSFMDIIKGVKEWDKETTEKNRKIIETLGNASAETALALKQLRTGDKTAMLRLETDISKKWTEAAALLHSTDKDLALMLLGKAQAWRNAEDWAEADYKIANDNLEYIDGFVKGIVMNAG